MGSCEHVNEVLSFIKTWNFLISWMNIRFPRNNSVR